MNRISKMIAGIQQAKDGNYAVRLKTSGRSDELDLLTEAINQLLHQMQERLSSAEATHLISELKGQQIELEMQNEELRLSQAQLEESRNRYADLYDFAPVGYLTVDVRGMIVEANLTAANLLEVERRQLLGRYFPHFLVDADRRVFRQLLSKGQNHKVRRQEIHLRDGKGGRLMLLDILFLQDAEGRERRLIALTDLTERQRTEEALQESEGRFRQAVEFSPLPIGIVTGDVPEYVNPEFVKAFGYTLEDLPNMAAWFRLAYPDPVYRQSVYELWQTAMERAVAESRPTEGLEVKVTCKDGSVRDVQVWSVPMGDKMLAFCHDFTERKRVEEALEKRLVALSRPLDEAGDLKFDDLFDLNDIQRIQDLFSQVTGVAALITTPDGIPITRPSNFSRLCRDFIRQSEKGARNCRISDAYLGRYNPDGPIVHHCLSAGLCNAGASITVGGKHVANWLVGQVRDGTQDEESMREYARTLGVDEKGFMAAFSEIPVMTEDQFMLVAQAHFLLANQLSNMAYQNIQQARFITERQRAEEELRQNEKKYRSLYQEFQGILNAIPDIVCLLSPDLRIVWANEVAARAVEKAQVSEILGTQCYFLRHARSEPCKDCPVVRCFQSGQLEVQEVISYGKYWDLHAVPLYDDEGNLRGAIEVARDITERRRAEEELQEYRNHLENLVAQRTEELSRAYQSLVENEARYRLLAENITDVIWTMDFDLRFTYLSPSVELLRGFTPQETMAQPLEEIFAPESLKTIRQILKEELSKEQQETGNLAWFREFEAEMWCQDGSSIWVEIRASFIRDLNLRPVGLLGVARDISRRRHAEEALRESEARFRTIFSNAPLGIVLRDLEGHMLEANPAALKILGYSFDELSLCGPEFIHPDDYPSYQEFMEGLAKKGADYGEMELRAQRKDGTWAWGRLHLSLIRDPGGEVRYLLGMIEDISKLKLWEDEIKTYQERLRSLAAELILTEERERRRLATSLHDNIGQVLALTQIKLGALADAATSPLPKKGMTEVRNLITQVIHTTRFLTFELGSPILYELGLEEAMEALLENYEHEYGLRITMAKEPLPVPPDDAASLLLFRALQELLTNVVKHARAQRVWVSLHVKGDQLELQVKDDGKGFTARDNSGQLFRHLGFGLFSLRERLSQMGGDLEVQSYPGQGTSVRVTIPLSTKNMVSHGSGAGLPA